MTFTKEYWIENSRPNKLRKTDKCASPQCNVEVFGEQFYCDSCKDRMKKSVYGNYIEVIQDW